MSVDVGTGLAIAGVLIAAAGAWWARKALTPQKQVQSRDRWVSERRKLNTSRAQLAKSAAHLHVTASPTICAIEETSMLAMAGWSHQPIPLHEVQIEVRRDLEVRQTVFLNAAESVLPIAPHGKRYSHYSDAMGDLARPTLFEDRVSYRLVELEVTDGGRMRLQFSTGRYFEMLNIAEPLAHEFANAVSGKSVETAQSPRLWKQLPLRKMFRHDLLRMSDRAVLPSIGTLLLRVDGEGKARFLLHKRDPRAVAIAGGHYSLVPAGMFQPSSASPASIDEDFDLWRSIQREAAEELLGVEEAVGDGGVPIDYACDEPYASFERARAAGALAIWSLGWGIDPLTLTLELMTVLTVEAMTYDRLFDRIVSQNAEGHVVAAGRTAAGLRGFPFTAETIEALAAKGELSPVAEACLRTALRHKAVIAPPVA